MQDSVAGMVSASRDLFSSSNYAPLSSLKVSVEKPKPGTSFSDIMSKTQKTPETLAEPTKELTQKIEKVSEQMESLKKDSTISKDEIQPLEDLLDQVKSMIIEDTEEPSMMEELLEQMVAFLLQAQEELSQTGELTDRTYYLAEKLSFDLEGLKPDLENGTITFAQKRLVSDMMLQAKSVENDSKIFLANIDESLLSDAEDGKILLANAEISDAIDIKEPLNLKESPIVVDDRRTSLKAMLKEQALEVKLALNGSPEENESPVAQVFAETLASKMTDAPTKIEAPTSPAMMHQIENMMSQIGARSLVVLRDGGSEFKMKLTPPELGQMKISFRLEEGMMMGKIVVSTPEAKALFEENMNMLKESFKQSGINIAQVDVSLGDGRESFEKAQDIIENHTSYKAVRVTSPIEMMSRGLSMSEIDYTA
ncbi:MAG: flagellar hook-length control protein FliK [Brevinema sp.]